MAFETRGTVEAVALLASQIERLRRPGPALEVAARSLQTLIDGSMAAGQSPGGARWRRRKPTGPVQRGRRRQGAAHPPLQLTGALRRSIIIGVERDRIRLRVSLYYAKFHQFGTTRMPARPILPFTAKGKPLRRGPAGDWLTTFRLALARYVVRGEV